MAFSVLSERRPVAAPDTLEVSVVIPCLNEADSIAQWSCSASSDSASDLSPGPPVTVPDRPYRSSLVWAVWIATGFHVNGHTMTGLDPSAEALNEGAKTLWALAYLVPLMRSSRAEGATVSVAIRDRLGTIGALRLRDRTADLAPLDH